MYTLPWSPMPNLSPSFALVSLGPVMQVSQDQHRGALVYARVYGGRLQKGQVRRPICRRGR